MLISSQYCVLILINIIFSLHKIHTYTDDKESCDYTAHLDGVTGSTHCHNKIEFGRTEKYNQLHKLIGKIGEKQSLILGNRNIEMTTLSMKPLVFEISNFLTPEECDHMISLAIQEGMEDSHTTNNYNPDKRGIHIMDINKDQKLTLSEMMLTIEDSFDTYMSEQDVIEMYDELGELDANHDKIITPNELERIQPSHLEAYIQNIRQTKPQKRSRDSQQTWIFPDQSTDQTFQNIQTRVQQLTHLPEVLIKKSDFQIVHYRVGGHFNAHHDSADLPPVGKRRMVPCCTRTQSVRCRMCRYATVLFYLNDVEEGGGTAFPVAGNETYDVDVLRGNHQINLQEYCNDANLVVKPSKGKAVLWYNHYVDPETGWLGELDPYSWHGGCPVIKGEKWIANFWIKVTDDKDADLGLHTAQSRDEL